jgi:hypothetical protein
MDKFQHQLGPHWQTAIVRPNLLSSAIQKPAHRPPQPRRTPGQDAAKNYCTCRRPFNPLLPKGTPLGMPFRLIVMLTDWTIDQKLATRPCLPPIGRGGYLPLRVAGQPERTWPTMRISSSATRSGRLHCGQ